VVCIRLSLGLPPLDLFELLVAPRVAIFLDEGGALRRRIECIRRYEPCEGLVERVRRA
jgi:hypothetical protein